MLKITGKKILSLTTCIILLGLLGACDKIMYLHPAGIIAKSETRLLIITTMIILVIVIPTMFLAIYIPIKYRASNPKAKYNPKLTHGVAIELIWWFIPIIIIVILGVITWVSTHNLDPYKKIVSKKKPVIIQVVSLNWRWLFIYPKQKIATINFVEFPVNTPVHFKLTSDAPMNSFVIRQLGGQIYTMAGSQTHIHLMANKKGNYQGLSLNFSGDGFANMSFIAKATSVSNFNKWVKKVKRSKKHLSLHYYNKTLVPDSKNSSVKYYSGVESNLFLEIINKHNSKHYKMIKSINHSQKRSVDK